MDGKEFEDLGTLKEFCEKYGRFKIYFEDIGDYNICLKVITYQEIEFKILCSNALSEIIRKDGKLPENIDEYHILRITTYGRSYIRVSQSISVEGDPNLDVWENLEKVKDLPGSVSIWFKAEELNVEPYKNEKLNLDDLDDLIAL